MKLLLLPFVLIWRLFALVVQLTGRLLSVVIGLALVVVGGLLTVTIVGAPIGVPLLLVGVLMVLRGLF